MALVNPNIALGVQPVQFESPMKMAMAANQLRESQLKSQEYESAMQERNALRQLNPSDVDYANQLMRVSPTQGIAYRKSLGEAQSAEATRTKTLVDAAAARQKMAAQALRDISQRPSDANITAHMEDVQESPLYDVKEKAAVTKRTQMLLEMPFEERKSFLASQGATPGELKPTLTPQALGGTARIMQTAPFGGAATMVPGSEGAVTMTPAQIAANKIAQGQLGVSQGQLGVSQGQLGVAQQRLAQEGQGVTYQQDAQGNIVALPSRLAAGGMPVARPVTGEGGAPVKGKPTAFAEKATAQRQQLGKDINQAIFELKNVAKEGGLIDQSTGSGAGKLVDIAAGFGGKAMPGAIAAGQLAPIADLVLKMVPRFEGPQSDKDTQSYKQAAGQLADTSMPTKIRKAAANEIIRLMESRKNQFASSDMAAEGVTPTAPRIAPPAGFTPDQQ
jgi:hypothetical protein